MREVTLAGHKVRLYQSIEELPMQRFHKYNKCLMIDAGLGSDMVAMDGHLERVVQYIRNERKEEAAKEIENIRQTMYLILQEQSPKHLSFACLVESIDGKPVDDVSDDGLKHILELLGDVPVGEVTAQSDAVKKKIDEELMMYFPQLFESNSEKEFYDIIKERTQAMLRCILEGDTEENKQKVDRLTGEMVMFAKPLSFNGQNNTEVEYDRRYEDMCLVMSQELHINMKKCTVMEYYNAYQFLQKQRKGSERQNKAH